MRQIGETKSYFGPAVYIDDQNGTKYTDVDFDVIKMGANLQHDFPDLAQEDWDRACLCLTGNLPGRYGGLAVNLLPMRNSVAARTLYNCAERVLSKVIYGVPGPSYKQIDRWSQGSDVAIVVNLATEFGVPENGFLDESQNDFAMVVAHELKHSVDSLLANRTYEKYLQNINSQSRKVAAYVGCGATGLAFAAGGSIGAVFGLAALDGATMLAGGATVAAGAALVAAPLYSAVKYEALSPGRFGIENPARLYGVGELCADAYALATHDKWEDVLKI